MIRAVESNHNKQEQKTKVKNIRFNEVQQFAYILEAEGRDLINLITNKGYKIGYNTLQFIAREFHRKKNQKL